MSPLRDRLHELLDYDPETGRFHWRRKPSNRCNDLAGVVKSDSGYRSISIDSVKHYAHRLAWLYVYGHLPEMKIDHINGERDDNRIGNLRVVDDHQNAWNRHRLHPRNTSGFLGVGPSRGKWRAQITTNGRNKFLGRFSTAEEAAACYEAARLRRDGPESFEELAEYCGVDAPPLDDGDPPR